MWIKAHQAIVRSPAVPDVFAGVLQVDGVVVDADLAVSRVRVPIDALVVLSEGCTNFVLI